MSEPASVKQAVGEPVREDRFPYDRVVFFCDAVFAIVITLLAIELRLPGKELIEQLGSDAANSEFATLFISYFISFIVTGLFWTGHMLSWKHVTRVNGRLVWLALLQLFFVVLMPFATREYSAAVSEQQPDRFVFYSLVLTGISLFSWLTRRQVVKQEGLYAKLGRAQTRWLLARGLIPFVVFACTIPLGFVLPAGVGVYVFGLILPFSFIAKRWIFAKGD